jgi:trk system potassium uptake protein TrkH
LATTDFNLWDFAPKFVLVALMFIGASAGSTGGGIKVIRLLIVFKVMIAEIERVFRPGVVRPIKVGSVPVDAEMRQATLVYVLGIFGLAILGGMLLMLFEGGDRIDVVTAATASAATLNNIGPGLVQVGAVQNYGWFSAPSMVIMSLLMVLGRLEVYAVLVLFMPRFWRQA